MVDRQEEIRVKLAGRRDTLEQAGPSFTLGQEQPGLGKALGPQFLLDPASKTQIEDELSDVASASGAF
jgi:hypothetical protein